MPKLGNYTIQHATNGHQAMLFDDKGNFESAISIDANKAWQEALLKLIGEE